MRGCENMTSQRTTVLQEHEDQGSARLVKDKVGLTRTSSSTHQKLAAGLEMPPYTVLALTPPLCQSQIT